MLIEKNEHFIRYNLTINNEVCKLLIACIIHIITTVISANVTRYYPYHDVSLN